MPFSEHTFFRGTKPGLWRHSRAIILAALILAVGSALALTIPGAWRETQRREAYLPQLEAMARRAPYDGRLLALLGGRQMEAGEFSDSADSLEHAIALGEKSEVVWLSLAADQAALGDPKALGYLGYGANELKTPGLAAALDRCRALGPNPAPTQLAAAICPQGPQPLVAAYTRGSFLNRLWEWQGHRHPETSGFTTRQDWVRQAPSDAQAQRLWGLALLRNRRPAEAATGLQQAVALAPNSPAAHLALAALLEQQTQTAQAALEYVTCLKLTPNWLPALLGLGRTVLTLQLPNSAAACYTRATEVAPDSAEAWIGRGQAHVTAGDNDADALNDFQTAARLAPQRTDFFVSQSTALRQLGRWDEAESFLRRRLAAVPGDAYSHYLLGQLLYQHTATPARLAQAEAETREAIRLAPQIWPAKQQLAVLLLRQGKAQEAIPWLRQVLAGDSGNVDALLTLERAQRQLGLTAQADETNRQAAVISNAQGNLDMLKTRAAAAPADIGLHQQLAVQYARAHQPDQARQEQQVIALLRKNPSLNGQRAQTLQKMILNALGHS